MFGPPDTKKLAAKRDIGGLIKALSHKDVHTRRLAMYAMEELKDPAFVEPLVHAAFTDSDREARERALYALGILKDPRAIPPLLGVLAEVNQHKDWIGDVDKVYVDAAIRITKTLAKFEHPLAAGAFIDALGSGYESLWKAGSAGLVQLGDRAVGPLAESFGGCRASARTRIVALLGEIASPDALDQLEGLVACDDIPSRELASKLLAKHGRTPKDDKAFILAAIYRGDFEAVIAKGRSALPALETALREEIDTGRTSAKWGIRARIASAMIRLGERSALIDDALMQAALCDDESQRQVAVKSLVEAGPGIRPRLLESLKPASALTVVRTDIAKWFWKESPAWAILRAAGSSWFLEALREADRGFFGWVLSRAFAENYCITRQQQMEKVKFLLSAGAETNVQDSSGAPVLTAAVKSLLLPCKTDLGSGLELVTLLLSKGADANARDAGGLTPLLSLPSAWRSNIDRIFDFCMDDDVYADNVAGAESQREHLVRDMARVVDLLAERGADVNAQDREGKTLLAWASKLERGDAIVQRLLARGATPLAAA